MAGWPAGRPERVARVAPLVWVVSCVLSASFGFVVLVPAAMAGASPGRAEQRCLDHFKAETARIERQAGRRRPAAADTAARQAWSAWLQAELARAADKAEACSRAARADRAGNSR